MAPQGNEKIVGVSALNIATKASVRATTCMATVALGFVIVDKILKETTAEKIDIRKN